MCLLVGILHISLTGFKLRVYTYGLDAKPEPDKALKPHETLNPKP